MVQGNITQDMNDPTKFFQDDNDPTKVIGILVHLLHLFQDDSSELISDSELKAFHLSAGSFRNRGHHCIHLLHIPSIHRNLKAKMR